MIRTQPKSVLNWSACAELIGDTGMVELLAEVTMQENDIRDQVQRLIEAATAHRDMSAALRQAEARHVVGVVEQSPEVEAMLTESRTMLANIERRLFSLTGRSDANTAYTVVLAAEAYLDRYIERVLESGSTLAERFCDQADAGHDATQDLHEMLDLAIEARSTALRPLQQLLQRSRPAPMVVDSGKQLTLVH